MAGLSEISRKLKWEQEYLPRVLATPAVKKEGAELRMSKIIINEKYCKGCTLCINFCPQKIIRTANSINVGGYHPAEFCDPEGKCTGCTLCAMMCPDAAITVYRDKKTIGDRK
jgi:2-oxoglutarate ferredoxin oxidoreductase subunit delta